jgi:hypothetical protein
MSGTGAMPKTTVRASLEFDAECRCLLADHLLVLTRCGGLSAIPDCSVTLALVEIVVSDQRDLLTFRRERPVEVAVET